MDQIDPAALDVFEGKIPRKLETGWGLVAINGFSPTPRLAITLKLVPRVMLMDGADLWAVLEGRCRLPDVHRRPVAQHGELLFQRSAY